VGSGCAFLTLLLGKSQFQLYYTNRPTPSRTRANGNGNKIIFFLHLQLEGEIVVLGANKKLEFA
jgi:hypothetical protein